MDYGQISAGELLDGRFEVRRLVKSGGMGAVYEATDRLQGSRICALKQIRPSADPKEYQQAKSHFIGEIGVMQALSHPNIPRIITSFFYNDSFFFAMEYIDGIDLARFRKANGNPGLPVSDVVSWAVQALDALSYVHDRPSPIVHRDIKPSNLLLDQEKNRVVLIDFGIAMAIDPADGWIGTPGYAPAEQQMGKPEPKSDLYGLAASVHELLSGIRPKTFDFASLASLGIEAPAELQAVLDEALEPWPQDRIATAAEMRERLLNLPGVAVRGQQDSREHDFEAALNSAYQELIVPILRELISRFGGECQTPYITPTISFNRFVLGSMTTFELIMTKDVQRESLRFEEKNGLLMPILLGEIFPLKGVEPDEVASILERYTDDYECSKNSSWQIM